MEIICKAYAFPGNILEHIFEDWESMDQRIWKDFLGRLARSNQASRFKETILDGLGKVLTVSNTTKQVLNPEVLHIAC